MLQMLASRLGSSSSRCCGGPAAAMALTHCGGKQPTAAAGRPGPCTSPCRLISACQSTAWNQGTVASCGPQWRSAGFSTTSGQAAAALSRPAAATTYGPADPSPSSGQLAAPSIPPDDWSLGTAPTLAIVTGASRGLGLAIAEQLVLQAAAHGRDFAGRPLHSPALGVGCGGNNDSEGAAGGGHTRSGGGQLHLLLLAQHRQRLALARNHLLQVAAPYSLLPPTTPSRPFVQASRAAGHLDNAGEAACWDLVVRNMTEVGLGCRRRLKEAVAAVVLGGGFECVALTPWLLKAWCLEPR
jgi:hypothetical protein